MKNLFAKLCFTVFAASAMIHSNDAFSSIESRSLHDSTFFHSSWAGSNKELVAQFNLLNTMEFSTSYESSSKNCVITGAPKAGKSVYSFDGLKLIRTTISLSLANSETDDVVNYTISYENEYALASGKGSVKRANQVTGDLSAPHINEAAAPVASVASDNSSRCFVTFQNATL